MLLINNPHLDLEGRSYTFSNLSTLICRGDDCERFLNGQLANDVSRLLDKEFQGQVRLNRSGQVQSFFYLLKKTDSEFIILVQSELCASLLEDLNKYIIMDDVIIEKGKHGSISLLISNETSEGFRGKYARLNAFFTFDEFAGDSLTEDELNTISDLGGEPLWDRTIRDGQLVTDTFAMLNSVSLSKGCYLGQETVSKIESRRGGNYFPVALTGDNVSGELRISKSRVGEVVGTSEYKNTNYTIASLKRDFRVEAREITFDGGAKLKVTYLPLWNDFDLEKVSDDLYCLAVELFQKGENDSAITILYKIIKLNPAYADAYESIGVILGRQEKYEEAIKLMDKLMSIDENSVMAHTNKSLYLMKLGKIEEAEEEKAQATVKSFARFGQDAASKRESEKLEEKNRSELARREQMFKDVLEIDEEDALANYGLADILFSRESYVESIVHLDKVLITDPKYSVAYLLLAKSLIKNNMNERACRVLDLGIDVASKNGDLMPASEMQSLLNGLS
jgi:folate-binding Fe-S cluster repair protein YgfZ/Flp pilus assembly protein TadD